MGTAMYTALGILAAYITRERTGKGQRVDVALLDTAVSWLTMLATDYQATKNTPGRMGSASPLFAPYQAFQAKDGYLTVIGTGGKDHWQRFCLVLNREEWIDDARFKDNAARIENLAELTQLIEGVMSTASVDEWIERLESEGLACDPIQSLNEVLDDPQVQAREMIVSIEHPFAGPLKMTGVPIKLSMTPGSVNTPPPLKGEHTDEILMALGYDENDISFLHETGVV
jgi:crotonobetainyl-CoA:carnitine CoA-transferase CaiB-like acyl-CoA transferase